MRWWLSAVARTEKRRRMIDCAAITGAAVAIGDDAVAAKAVDGTEFTRAAELRRPRL